MARRADRAGESAQERGVVVTSVLPGSPADIAGIKKDDAILRVDNTRVEAAADLQAAIAEQRPGKTVKLVVRRNGERKSFDVELGSFARWHGDVGLLSDFEVRELLSELLATPLAMAENRSADPDEGEAKEPLREEVALPKVGVAVLTPTKGSEVQGTIAFRQKEDGLHLTGKVSGLTPGLHGFHIHEFGDLRNPQGKSAGGHFNPGNTAHGGPADAVHHAGDLGNIEANADGIAHVDIVAPWLKLHFVIGRSIVVHGGEDDLVSQPSGDAGAASGTGCYRDRPTDSCEEVEQRERVKVAAWIPRSRSTGTRDG